MAVGKSVCDGCGKEFKWKRTTGIPAKWCSRSCQKIRINRLAQCEVCGKEYSWKESKHKKKSRFCSRECCHKKVSSWRNLFEWQKASQEEKIAHIEKIFLKNAIKQEGCWDWKGKVHKSGYTCMMLEKTQTSGHRISWLIHNGNIPEGLFIFHKCDNRKCTNPEHLFLGTQADNALDRDIKDRVPRAKLKNADVIEIKKMLKLGVKGTFLAKKYNVNPVTIYMIQSGKSWKHIEEHEC